MPGVQYAGVVSRGVQRSLSCPTNFPVKFGSRAPPPPPPPRAPPPGVARQKPGRAGKLCAAEVSLYGKEEVCSSRVGRAFDGSACEWFEGRDCLRWEIFCACIWLGQFVEILGYEGCSFLQSSRRVRDGVFKVSRDLRAVYGLFWSTCSKFFNVQRGYACLAQFDKCSNQVDTGSFASTNDVIGQFALFQMFNYLSDFSSSIIQGSTSRSKRHRIIGIPYST